MRPALLVLALTLAPGATPGPAAAAGNVNATLLLHVSPTRAKNPCEAVPVRSCEEFSAAGPDSGEAFVYLLVSGVHPKAGLSGVQFAIGYDAREGRGVDILEFRPCGFSEIPEPAWPDSGAGIRLYASASNPACLEGGVRVAGVFAVEIHGRDRLRLLPAPPDGMAAISDCALSELLLESVDLHPEPSPLGYAEFGGGKGYAPCGGAPEVEGSRWRPLGTRH
jgi:hypothetical protein